MWFGKGSMWSMTTKQLKSLRVKTSARLRKWKSRKNKGPRTIYMIKDLTEMIKEIDHVISINAE